MRKNETFIELPARPAPTEVEDVKKADAPPSLANGTILRYTKQDSGQNYPDRGLYLAPGYDYEVGEDLDGVFANRLVEDGYCTIFGETQFEEDEDETVDEEEVAAAAVVATPELLEATPLPAADVQKTDAQQVAEAQEAAQAQAETSE